MTVSDNPNIRIKFCGMTRPQDAKLASDLGADAIGCIFYPKSARHVELEQAKQVVEQVNPFCTTVAVVVNPSADYLNEIISAVSPNLIQFHGDETADFCSQFGLPYVKAVRMKDAMSLPNAQAQHQYAQAFLLDTYDKNLKGGTGERFDWELLAHSETSNLILAGGLSANNIELAASQTTIRSFDLNSGVEVNSGVKDHDKIRKVMRFKRDYLL